MLAVPRALARRFAASIGGSSAVEFAVIFPVILVLMIFGVQVVTYINAVRKVELLVASMSEAISQAVPPSNSTTVATVNAQDIHFYYDSGLVVFPYLMKDGARQNIQWWQDITIDFAGIQFVAIPSKTCSGQTNLSPCYTANVVWTSSGTSGNNSRPCGKLASAVDTAAPTATTLPQSIFGPGSIVVVDVVFTFTPIFASRYMPNYRIARSVYVQPRYATLISYDNTNSDGIAVKCPGY